MSALAEEPEAGERAAYAAVDEAMRTFPLEAAPSGLAPAVLATLRQAGREAARPVFRLSWIDFALSGFVALMLALGWLVAGWLTPTAARLQMMASGPLFQDNGLVWVLALAGVGVTAGLLGVAGAVFRRR